MKMITNVENSTVSFGLYRIDKEYLSEMSNPEIVKETGVRCYSDYDLYCGPVMQTEDEETGEILNYFIPINEPDIENASTLKGENWISQLESFVEGLYGGYDFCTFLPCLDKYLTPANDISEEEKSKFEFVLENKDDLRLLIETVLPAVTDDN